MNHTTFQPTDDQLVDPHATADHRSYAMLMHLTALAHLFIPGFAIAIPIIMWQVKKNDSPFIDDHGREVTNFQITLLIYSFLLPALAAIVGVITCGVGFLLLPIVGFIPYILGLIGMVYAAMAANRGAYYRYPMTIRFIPSPA